MFRHDYGLTEKILRFWAPVTLGLLAVMSLGLRYVAAPISCWVPPEMTGAMAVYVHHVCFQKQSIFLGIEEPMPTEMQSDNKVPTYHQWIPFALGVSAILCLFPHALWRLFSGFLWLDAHALANTVGENQKHNAGARHSLLRDTAVFVLAGLKGSNWMLSAAVLVRKVLSLLTCVLLMVMTAVVFRPQLSTSGSGNIAVGVGHGVALFDHFLCDFRTRAFKNSQSWTVQCTLPLTHVYSKGFTFLFYIFLLLALLSVLDLLVLASRLAIPVLRDFSLKRLLSASEGTQWANPHLSRFLDSLGGDGRFLVAVVAEACGPLAAADLANHLWLVFQGLAPTPVTVPDQVLPAPALTAFGADTGAGQAEGEEFFASGEAVPLKELPASSSF